MSNTSLKIFEDVSELLNNEKKESLKISRKIEIGEIGDERIKIKSPLFLEINFVLNRKNEILANFKVKAELELSCDRCLNKFNKKINLKFQQIYRAEKNYLTEKTEEEILPILQNQTVEIFEPVRQEILLSLPYKILCNEKCKGIKYRH